MGWADKAKQGAIKVSQATQAAASSARDSRARSSEASQEAKAARYAAERESELRAAERRLLAFEELSRSCPVPLEPAFATLPGGLTLAPDEFLVRVAREWGLLSSTALTLTTARLIWTSGRATKKGDVLWLQDVRDVIFEKRMLHHGALMVQTFTGENREGLPAAKNAARLRDDILKVAFWARQRAQQVSVHLDVPSGQPAKPFAALAESSAAPPAEDIPEQIAKLASLRDQGVLTQREFDAKKAQLLDRM